MKSHGALGIVMQRASASDEEPCWCQRGEDGDIGAQERGMSINVSMHHVSDHKGHAKTAAAGVWDLQHLACDSL